MKNLFSYEGKRCLFAGCFSGMGEATARIVQSLGGTIVAADIKQPTSFAYERFFEVDLRDAGAIDELVAETASGGPIDRLFYCAGLPGTRPKVDVMAVNFVGLRHTIEAAVPHIPRGGAAVCISSSAGMGFRDQMQQILPLLETPDHAKAMEWVSKHQEEFEAYIFSKMCTIAYVLRRGALLAMEHGVRLNCTSPGPTDTPMIPDFIQQAGEKLWAAYPKPIENRYATPEEQGWPLAFLNSDAASYVSGENFCVDGGGASAMQQGTLVLDLAALLKE